MNKKYDYINKECQKHLQKMFEAKDKRDYEKAKYHSEHIESLMFSIAVIKAYSKRE